jgi:periplasmic protein TorT
MTKHTWHRAPLLAAITLTLVTTAAFIPENGVADDAWSAKVVQTEPVFDLASGTLVPADYQSLASGDITQKWSVCLLVPHTGSEYWVAYTYGAVEEARRQGTSLNIFSAGGYSNVAGQIGQLEDCVTNGANAIVLVTTSPAGLNNAIAEARRNGVVIVDAANGAETTDIDARVVVSYRRVGLTVGQYLAEKHPAGSGEVTGFYLAGPPGATYVEALRQGFYDGLEGSDVNILEDYYAPSNKAEQLPLVEDGLQAYPDVDYIIGGAPGIEAALDTVRQMDKDISLIATFQTPFVWDAVENGEVEGVVSDFAVLQARLAIDTALRILEKKPFMQDVAPDSLMIDASNVGEVDRSTSLAPAGWEPVSSVE